MDLVFWDQSADMMSDAFDPNISTPPGSLLELLFNNVVFENILSNLSLAAIFALSRTSHAYRDFLLRTPNLLRYLDLSNSRGAYIADTITRIDSGGHSWRAERIDENLTEDEFYSGPLRGVLYKVAKLQQLRSVLTLVLDGLATVTVDLVTEIVTSKDYNVRLLSIRNCRNVNKPILQQMLRYICRPSRPEGSPRLKGIYVFPPPNHILHGETLLEAQTEDIEKTIDPSSLWYAPSGNLLLEANNKRSSWEETLQACKGIICFDAVLCTHMHAEMAITTLGADSPYKPGIAPLANIALGPDGCSRCGRAPKDSPIWGISDYHEFPLIHPPPFSGKIIDAVRPPIRISPNGEILPQRLIVSCPFCVNVRHCESCHHWWCRDCDPINQSLIGQLGDFPKVFLFSCNKCTLRK